MPMPITAQDGKISQGSCSPGTLAAIRGPTARCVHIRGRWQHAGRVGPGFPTCTQRSCWLRCLGASWVLFLQAYCGHLRFRSLGGHSRSLSVVQHLHWYFLAWTSSKVSIAAQIALSGPFPWPVCSQPVETITPLGNLTIKFIKVSNA